MRAAVQAADLDDPSVPDGATQLDVELEQICIEDADELVVVAVLPALGPSRRFTSESGVPSLWAWLLPRRSGRSTP